jgi:hypothetical protein
MFHDPIPELCIWDTLEGLHPWAMRKFKRFKDHKVRASQFLQRLAAERKALFVHWDIGMTGVFA